MDSPLDRARQLIREGKLEQAEGTLRRMATRPGAPFSALVDLSRVLKLRGNKVASEQFAAMALSRCKEPSEFHEAGALLDSLGLYDRAVEAYSRGVALRPDDAGSWNGLGLTHIHANRIDEAIAALARARELSPDNTVILTNFAWAQSLAWRLDQAVDLVRGVVSKDPGDVEARKLLAFLLNYSDRATPREVFEAHVPFGEHFEAMAASVGLPKLAPTASPRTGPLRVGLLSPDFRDHPVARFVEPLLEGRDPKKLALHCYSISPHQDATTTRLRSLADRWKDLVSLDDVAATMAIREDDLDLLVDLNGHTAGGRPGILALRGARKQATYLGYPNTTGLRTMDARLVDAITDPAGFEELATERLVRLSPCFLCFRPTDVARNTPPRDSTPTSDQVTFGSFNTLRKLTPRLLATWCEILRRVPTSKLVLKNSGVGSAGVGRTVLAEFARHGIDEGRVALLGRLPDEAEHHRAYHRIDIALDTIPYNGTTTTCDALWMGVPVITMLGDRHVSRVSASILNAVGASELVANDLAGYIDIAVALAGDADRRRAFHASLRDRMETGALCDAGRFAGEFERAAREIAEG